MDVKINTFYTQITVKLIMSINLTDRTDVCVASRHLNDHIADGSCG